VFQMAKFTCDMCGGTFEDGWTEEEANAEAKENWGIDNASETAGMSVVCDDCYAKLSALIPQDVKERSKKLMMAKVAISDAPVDVASMISEGDLRYPFWPIGVVFKGEEVERIVMDWIDGVITVQSFGEAAEMFSVMKAQEFAGRLLYDEDKQDDYNTQCVDLRDGLILEGDVEFVEDRRRDVTVTAGRGVINDYAVAPIIADA
jgi:hypothetical protein